MGRTDSAGPGFSGPLGSADFRLAEKRISGPLRVRPDFRRPARPVISTRRVYPDLAGRPKIRRVPGPVSSGELQHSKDMCATNPRFAGLARRVPLCPLRSPAVLRDGHRLLGE